MFERVKELSKSRGKNLKQVAIELGFGENYFYTWKKKSPGIDKVQAVANYFNVSVDYLLGNDEKTNNPADDSIAYYRINVEGLSDEEVTELRSELNDYTDFLKEKLRKRNNGGD